MEEIKSNPLVNSTQEIIEENKNNPQVYIIQECIGEIKSNPQVYTKNIYHETLFDNVHRSGCLTEIWYTSTLALRSTNCNRHTFNRQLLQ